MNVDRVFRKVMFSIGAVAIVSFQASVVEATPEISAEFASAYPTATASIAQACLLCHTSNNGSKNNLNSYGLLVKQLGVSGAGNPELVSPTNGINNDEGGSTNGATANSGGSIGADADNDGISDDLEGLQDSDGDGVLDMFEPEADANDSSQASGMSMMNAGSLDIISIGRALSDVSIEQVTTDDVPAGVDVGFGVIHFTTTAPIGGSQTVRMTSSVAFPEPLNVFYIDTFGNATSIPEINYKQINATNLDLILTDGSEFDLDGIQNGSIVAPIAFGKMRNSGCFISSPSSHLFWMAPLLLILLGVAMIRKETL
ncbi:MAG: choice-of-anchor U domain-containing protein [Mariprofundaceae bacterium]